MLPFFYYFKIMDIEYLNKYEQTLTDNLLRLAGQEQLLSSPDIDDIWYKIAPEYMVDAVPNIAGYPLVSIAWAGFFGMAVAHLWDKDVNLLKDHDGKTLYIRLRDARGFDEMDEHIIEDVLGYLLDSPTAHRMDDQMRSLAQLALDSIRHENIEPQTEMAFHVYARTVKAIYRQAASLELARLKYHLTPLN